MKVRHSVIRLLVSASSICKNGRKATEVLSVPACVRVSSWPLEGSNLEEHRAKITFRLSPLDLEAQGKLCLYRPGASCH